MFAFNGVFTQFDDPVNIINPDILAIAAGVRFPTYMARIWNRLQAPRKAIAADRYRVGARTMTLLSGVIGDGSGALGGWNNSATTSLKMAADAVSLLAIGSVMRIYSGATQEIVVVSAVDRSGNLISVAERGSGSTSPQTWADASTFEIIGGAINDTDAKNVESAGEKTYEYENYCQLFFEPIDITKGDSDEARKYLDSEPQLKEEALGRIFQKLARTIIKGVKVAGTKTIPGMTAGILDQMIDTAGGSRTPLRVNVNGAFTEAALKTSLDLAFKYGTPNAIYLSMAKKKIADAFANSVSPVVIATDQVLSTRGLGNSAKYYEYQGQQLEFVVDIDWPDDRVEIVTEDQIVRGFRDTDPLRLAEEPPPSSRQRRFSYQGKVGVAVLGVGFDHVDMYGLS